MHLAPSSKIAPAPPPAAAQLTPRSGGLVLKPPSIAAQPQVPLAKKFSSSSYQKQQQPPPSPAPAPPPPPPKEEPEYSEPPPPQPVVEEPPPAEPEAHKPLPPPIVVQSSQVTERGFERAPVLSCSCLTDWLLSLTPLLSHRQ